MLSEYLIEAKGITKIFMSSRGKVAVRAVDKVSLKIPEGSTITLIGESGCGKSTLGKLLVGAIKPTSGEILYKGKNIWKMNRRTYKEFRRNAQLIHQDPYSAFNPMKTIYDSLKAPLLYYRIVGKEEVYESLVEMLRRAGVEPAEDILNRYPHQLSGGQLQRLAIVRALSVNPKFVVADEIVSMLDASLRVEIVDLLKEFKKASNIACLFITHDFAIARYFAPKERALIMYLGKIVESGILEELIEDPLHPYTRALLDAVPELDPRVARTKGLPKLKSWEPIDVTHYAIPGCRFYPRCPYSTDKCKKIEPELIKIDNRYVACHLFK